MKKKKKIISLSETDYERKILKYKTNGIWAFAVLIFICILGYTRWFNLVEDTNLVNFISFAATGVSIALAIVAMAISISQNNSSNILNNQISNMITKIDTNLENIHFDVNNLNLKSQFFTPSESNYEGAKSKPSLNITRCVIQCVSEEKIIPNLFYEILKDYVMDELPKINILDFTLITTDKKVLKDALYVSTIEILLDSPVTEDAFLKLNSSILGKFNAVFTDAHHRVL